MISTSTGGAATVAMAAIRDGAGWGGTGLAPAPAEGEEAGSVPGREEKTNLPEYAYQTGANNGAKR